MTYEHLSQLPEDPSSYWIASTSFSDADPLKENTETDVVVVGAGITGITAAYLLIHEGFDVILLDADNILHGTTGHTTAKITAQHDLFYHDLIQHTSIEKARTYYNVNEEAKKFIETIVREHKLTCGFEEQDAVLYATSSQDYNALQKEKKAYETLGIPHEMRSEVPFNESAQAALAMTGQAQFHPLHYLTFLLEAFKKRGGKVYENTTITGMVEGERPVLETRQGKYLISRFVLSCTHFPFHDANNYYFTKMHAERSYVIAAKAPDVNGMYLSVDTALPKRSIRSVTINGENYLLIGGESHKTGQGKDQLAHYKALQSFAERVFNAKEFPYRWSAQDLYTLDSIPYIGVLTDNESNTFVATGYRKWGMTSGTAAAIMLKNYVLGNETEDMALFDPNRFLINPSLKHFLKHNSDVTMLFFADKLKPAAKKVDDIALGEGGIVSLNGRRAGVYRDKHGDMHAVDTTCKHLGCEVHWNNGDRTWDCPCHGSRYDVDGRVIEGPAKEPLDPLPE
ncbi:FAD-dependent oxidoreductase [Salipaludibacillus sp. LMS25]|jgi:glycine/D-amino acid oxidase-like deaminating enzyme/nitrite reductase/ring-hydroxylating ferredoxin subunit|uniref:FAD-dependent oxidoreductase n=1 Tax=Salipaludibacillus sp. LMS25 TaxID=2924031 RepID=UPI0020D0B868|nr:FAD-dependent oxidoreductase [Salipaludibacillus sp. LMS25]UTR16359.1 FAD-dependent oxidoreductase [Salipaludibacillus sp. LMS25]